ncbi:HET-domain-containing protein, partial [Paraphaeosphaeria sporulosa]
MIFQILIATGTLDPPHPHIDFKHHIPVSPLDKKCFDLVRSWAKECANHKICAKPAQVPLPKRVIEIPADLAQPCRLRAASHVQGHYVILSHCWGKSDIASKLKDSLISTFHNAIPYGELPKNFQDAIEITRCLGFRYLWIDALCISQDNAAEWAEEAPKMSSYYGLSTLMIAATVAEDSSKGILIDRHIKYSPAIGRQKEYCLRDERLSSLQDISNSALATRGWAAQERTLAPRILHYTTQQMIWECGNGFKFEASSLEYFIQVEDLDKSAIQPFVTNALQAPGRHKTVGGTTEETSIQESKRLAGWSSCVQNYTGRLLTFPSDKLYAISGVADILNHNGEMGEYLSGIWSKHFVAGLSWKRDSSTLLTTPPEYRAPSWSWASVDGAVFMEDI